MSDEKRRLPQIDIAVNNNNNADGNEQNECTWSKSHKNTINQGEIAEQRFEDILEKEKDEIDCDTQATLS